MLVLVPEPVWNTSSGNCASCAPAATSPAAASTACATLSSSSPSSRLARAAACFTSPSAAMNSRGQRHAADRKVLHRPLRLRAPQRVSGHLDLAHAVVLHPEGTRHAAAPRNFASDRPAVYHSSACPRAPPSPSAALDALSPVDGRYRAATAPLRALLSEGGPDPRAHPHRGAVAAASGCGAAAAGRRAAARRRCARAPGSWPTSPAAGRAGRGQGDRSAHQPRRQGGRVLRTRAARGRRRVRRDARTGALRLHLGRHQQPQLRATAAQRPRDAARGARRTHARADRARARSGRRRHAGAHPRPAGQPDHSRQGNRQLRGAPGARPAPLDGGQHPRQVERRSRQLQCARRGRAGGGLAGAGAVVRRLAGTRVQPDDHADRAA